MDSSTRAELAVQVLRNLPLNTEYAWLTRSMLIIVPFDEPPYLMDLRRDPPLRLNLQAYPERRRAHVPQEEWDRMDRVFRKVLEGPDPNAKAGESTEKPSSP